MCSVDDEEITLMTSAAKRIDLREGGIKCRKCHTQDAQVMLRSMDYYCRDCFHVYFTHKFRSTIGKSKKIQMGDQILVAVTTNESSRAMIRLIYEGVNEDSHRRLGFRPSFLHIDESCLRPQDSNVNQQEMRHLCAEIVSLGFPCFIVALESVVAASVRPTQFNEPWVSPLKDVILQDQFSNLSNSCESATSRLDVLYHLRKNLIWKCAQYLGFSKVFLGESATNLSMRVLTSIAQGRGSQLAGLMHFESLWENIKIYRPMRELLQNEITFYCKLNHLQMDSFDLVCATQPLAISECTFTFLSSLQENFPATIPTVFRTGDKLVDWTAVKGKNVDLESRNRHENDYGEDDMQSSMCALCALTIDTDFRASSALQSTELARNLTGIVDSKVEPKMFLPDAVESQIVSELNTVMETKDNIKIVGEICSDDCKIDTCCQEIDDSKNSGCSVDKSSGKCCHDAESKVVLSNEQFNKHLCYACRRLFNDGLSVSNLPADIIDKTLALERRFQMRKKIQDFLL